MKKSLVKKILLLATMIVLCFAVSIMAGALSENGSCGDSVTYTYNSSTGEVVISGTGAMADYSDSDSSPFSSSDIKSVIIEDGVIRIGNYAFCNCTNLESVTIGNSVTSIGDNAFCNCTSLESVTIGNSVTSIGDNAFYYCKSLQSVTIGDSVTSIGNYAFYNCTSLASVTIPDSVTSIGGSAFGFCASLESITVDADNQHYSSDEYGVLFNKDKTTLIQYPAGNTGTTYTIPDSVTSIGDWAFYYCTSLQSVTIGDSVTSIGEGAFAYCTSLESVTIPDSVTSIGWNTFSNCTSLASITIPDSVTSIGDYAFYCCESLESVTIPDSVTTISYSAFYNTGYYNNSSNWEDDVLYIGKYLIDTKTSLSGSYTIKDGTKVIADYAFSHRKSLQSVTIGNSVTSIGNHAFRYCESLTSVTIGDSVTSIGWYAFCRCTSLENVTIPDSVTSIGYYAFSDTGYYNNSSNWEDDVLYIGKYLIDTKTSLSGSYTIKDGTKVIADSAFYECTSLESVTIPDSVTSIGDNAFYYCKSLQSVTIGDSVTSIGDYAFYYCTSLQSVTIGDSVTSIGGSAFRNCTSLERVTIPDSVTTIGSYAFEYCTSLESITIPDSVTSIGDDAFRECTSLASITVNADNQYYSSDEYGVLFNKDKTALIQYPAGNTRTAYTIPDSVTSIGDYAFYWCTSLASVTIPDSVDAIGEYAFGLCISLTEVIIPAGVTTLGDGAFIQLPFLEKITIKSPGVEIGEYSLCANEFGVSGISREEFALLFAEALKTDNEELMAELEQYLVFSEEGIIFIGTIHCHEGSTAEAYAIENGVDYVLTHFYEGEWIYDYDEMIRYRKCIHCDELEIEPLETTSEGDVEIIEPVDPDTDFVVDEITNFVIIEETIENNVAGDFEVIKAFDITMKNKEGVHVQPDGTVKVKLPHDWSKNGIYKVYRINDDGSLTDMNAYREGSHMVFETDHFSVYVIVDESEKAEEPAPEVTEEKEGFFAKIIELLEAFFELIMSLFK